MIVGNTGGEDILPVRGDVITLAHVLGAGWNSPPAVIAHRLANFADPRD